MGDHLTPHILGFTRGDMMMARLRSWWQKIGKPLLIVGIIAACLLAIGLLVAIIGGYLLNWSWTGLAPYIPPTKVSNFQRGKTLWDWLQLLIIPVVLAIGGFLFSQIQKGNEQRVTDDNQQEAGLQDYIDSMSDLLLKEGLRKSDIDAEVRNIARVRTLTILSRVNTVRKRRVFEFLFESGLVNNNKLDVQKSGLIIQNKTIIDLKGADLSRVDLDYHSLERVNLSLTNMREASLSQAWLDEANLSGAVLIKAYLIGTQLNAADLRLVYLEEAILVGAQLVKANLSGARLKKANLTSSDLKEANLSRADFTEANLRSANLQGSNLTEANFTKAKLRYARLAGAKLVKSNLQGANLSGAWLQETYEVEPESHELYQLPGADLSEANLSNANLKGAYITQEQLKQAKSLKGATMPDGSIHP